MKRTTKSILALVVLVAMCVSFCVPAFATTDHDHDSETTVPVTGCPSAGEKHTLAIFGLEDHDWGTTPETEDVKLVEKVSEGCEEDGYSVYKCNKCGEYFVDSWVKAGEGTHSLKETVIKEPNCTEAGETYVECTVCGYTNTVYPAALGHNFDKDNDGKDDWTYSDPNYICSDEGVTRWMECTVCDYTTKGTAAEEKVDATEHKWVINFTVKPTCVTTGHATYKCENCTVAGEVEVPAMSKDDPLAHNWIYSTKAEDGYVAPTCQTPGKALNAKCTECGAEAAELELTTDHNFQAVAQKDATCTETGTKAHTACTYCGELGDEYKVVAKDENDQPIVDEHGNPVYAKDEEGNYIYVDLVIPALNHLNHLPDGSTNDDNRTYYTDEYEAPSCKGEFWYCADDECDNRIEYKKDELPADGKCKDCGKELAYDDGGLGHQYFDCSLCGGKHIHEEIARLEHPETKHTVQDPTCDVWGFESDACLVCGDYTYFKMLPPYTHDLNNPNNKLTLKNTIVEVTCQVDGQYVYTCGGCNKDIDITIPKKPHSYKEIVTPNTCVDDGYTEYKCEWCGLVDYTADNDDETETTKDGKYNWVKADPVNAHAYKTHWTTHPTCTAKGLSLTFCTACDWIESDENGKPLYKEVAPLNHDATRWNTHECKDDYTVLVKNGKVVTSTVEATCTVDKYDIWDCDLCGLKDQRDYYEDTALGHNYADAEGNPIEANIVNTVKVTCTTDGYVVVKCERFDECGTINTDDRCAAGCDTETCTSKTHDSSDEFVTEKLGHDFDYTDVVREDFPQCVDDPTTEWNEKVGRIWTECQNDCGEESFTASVRKFDINDDRCHANAAKDPTKPHRPATCAERGIEYWYCEACEEDFGKVLPSPEHTPDGAPQGKDPTCTDDGVIPFYTCTECQQKIEVLPEGKTAEDYKKLGHNWVEADCDEARHCLRCGTVDPDKPALGHKWVDATCEEAKHCTVCGETEGLKLDHNVIASVVVPNTCVDDGYTYDYCDRCFTMWNIRDYKYATGHTSTVLNADKTKAPTCTTAGVNVYDCAVCGAKETKTEEVAALTEDLLHTNKDGQKFGDNCVAGVTDYVCTTPNCGHKTPIHSYKVDEDGNRIPYKVTGSCLEYRYVLYICEVCEEHDLAYLEPEEEHDWSDWTVDPEHKPTLTEDGIEYRVCNNVCNAREERACSLEGVLFDFSITNLVGATEEDGYAGRIKLVIDLKSNGTLASVVYLNIGFSSNLQFVRGELTSPDFTAGEGAFTSAEAANQKGYVVVSASSSQGDVTLGATNDELAEGEEANYSFAVLYFDIKVNSVGEDIEFKNNTTTTDNSTPSGIANSKGDVITPIYGDLPTAKTTRFGDLTPAVNDDKVTIDDAATLLDMIKDQGETFPYCSEADLNKDGEITALDYAILRSLLLGDIENLG